MKKLFLLSIMLFSAPAFAAPTQTTLTFDDAWVRAAAPQSHATGAFITLHNDTGTEDRLVRVSTDHARMVQIHETIIHPNGMMEMNEIEEGIVIPNGKSLYLKPGGYHIMLMGLEKPVEAGNEMALRFEFEKAADFTVRVPILPINSKGPNQE